MLDRMVADIERKRGLSPGSILSKDRSKRTTEARHEVFEAMRRMGYSYPEIGLYCGRNHSTVIVGIRSLAAKQERLRQTRAAAWGTT